MDHLRGDAIKQRKEKQVGWDDFLFRWRSFTLNQSSSSLSLYVGQRPNWEVRGSDRGRADTSCVMVRGNEKMR